MNDHLSRCNCRPVLPRPYASLEEFNRLNHFDLQDMSDLALWKERVRVDYQLARYDGPEDDNINEWLLERLAAVRAELKARGLDRAN
jgi:hypothetical protein